MLEGPVTRLEKNRDWTGRRPRSGPFSGPGLWFSKKQDRKKTGPQQPVSTGLDRSFTAIILLTKFPLKQAQDRLNRIKTDEVIVKSVKS